MNKQQIQVPDTGFRHQCIYSILIFQSLYAHVTYYLFLLSTIFKSIKIQQIQVSWHWFSASMHIQHINFPVISFPYLCTYNIYISIILPSEFPIYNQTVNKFFCHWFSILIFIKYPVIGFPNLCKIQHFNFFLLLVFHDYWTC